LNDWKTQWPDCDIRMSFFVSTKISLTPRDLKGKGWSRDWHICYLPESNNISPEVLGILKCPFNTIPEPKDSIPAEFTEKVQHLLGSQQTGAPYTGYYTRLNNALVSVSNVYSIWFEVCLQENKFECFQLAWSELELKNHPLPGINFKLLKQTRVPTQPPTWPPSYIETQPIEGGGLFTLEQLATAMTSAPQEQPKRIPTPFKDPSSNKDKPKDKEPFRSFKI